MKELGLYIHLPFCRKKCPYCDFYSITDSALIEPYFEALERELLCYEDIIYNSIIKTIYVGGGTPSLVAPEYFMGFFSKIKHKSAEEITIEVNPDSFTTEFASAIKDIGFNRLSIGVQSFNDDELRFLDRLHNADQAKRAVEIGGNYFENINVDLIYGLPGQTKEQHARHSAPMAYEGGALYSIDRTLQFPVKHISAYELTIYPGTKMHQCGYRQDQDPDKYFAVSDRLESAGFDHYEISNFAAENYQCRHNLGYWNDREYLGLGISAASCFDDTRRLNISTIEQYLQNDFQYQQEPATESEYIISALRTSEGIDLAGYRAKFKQSFLDKYQKILGKLKSMIVITENSVCLTRTGQIFSNKVFEEFV